MRRGRFLRGAVAPVWCEGVTAAQMQDFVETYEHLHEIYGPDATQEAVAWTLHKAPEKLAAYLIVCARAIAHTQYHDGGRGLGASKTWDCEVLHLSGSRDDPADMPWSSTLGRDPELRAIAREELRRLTEWLVALHLTTGFRVRKAYWQHGPDFCYFHPTQTGGAVQCRRCLSRRNQIRRQRRRARQEVDHVAAR